MSEKKVLLQCDIELAMRNTTCNTHAANFLGVTLTTYKRYASQYFDKEGNNLYKKHLNRGGRHHLKFRTAGKTNEEALQAILAGRRTTYPLIKLRDVLLYHKILEPKCEICGFSECRITDKKRPLLLARKNDDKTDYSLENLTLLCYNCFFLTVGNIVGKRTTISDKWK